MPQTVGVALIFDTVLMIAAAIIFGWAVALRRLLDRGGYRWFGGAQLVVGAGAAVAGAAMLWLSLDGTRAFWLAALASGLLLGRVRRAGELITFLGLAAYLGVWCVAADNPDLVGIAWMSGALVAIGVAQRWLKKTRPNLGVLTEEKWAWLLVVSFYCFMVELDLGLVMAAYTYQSSTAALDDDKARLRLRSWGIKPPLRG